MNLVLLAPEDFIDSDNAVLTGRRYQHALKILKIKQGDHIKVGQLNGRMGQGYISAIKSDQILLNVHLDTDAPKPLSVHLVLALPRPIVFKRVLQSITMLGVKHITLLNSQRVEKSFWQSPALSETSIQEQLILGLEQARDTHLPLVSIEKRFKPFVQDKLPSLLNPVDLPARLGLVAHPGAALPCPLMTQKPAIVFVGPEGGFVDYEIELLQKAGCCCVHIGSRILKVEVALANIIGRFFS